MKKWFKLENIKGLTLKEKIWEIRKWVVLNRLLIWMDWHFFKRDVHIRVLEAYNNVFHPEIKEIRNILRRQGHNV
jgi:hypothetical protein